MATLTQLLDQSLAARQVFIDPEHFSAFRLFNGFLEGCPDLSVDIYAHTALLHDYVLTPNTPTTAEALDWIKTNLPWVTSILCKTRQGSPLQKRGVLLHGSHTDHKVREDGIWYAIDLTLNRDASFYLDTRNLRSWARHTLTAKTVLNTFAYTGSLGLAALMGGAARVVQLDHNQAFLNLAKSSYALNGLPITHRDFIVADFFPAVGQLKRSSQLFDCVFLDPPFFSTTAHGQVDLETGSTRLINKVRPLIKHDGWLVAINNALYVSGADYLASLQALCSDGYLSLEQILPVPEDFTGFSGTRLRQQPVDPAPFNHSTKIAILRVKRKSQLPVE